MYRSPAYSPISGPMKISFRPHHFLCTLGFQGRGYSPAFIKNYIQIVEALHKDEELPIEVVGGVDSICEVCPRNEAGFCKTESKIQALDKRHAKVLDLIPGETLTWIKGKARIKEKMTLDAFHHACEGCQWKALGVCEEALKKLHYIL